MQAKNICGMTRDEIFNEVSLSFPINPGQANVIANQVYKKGITDFSSIPGISRKLKSKLDEIFTIGVHKPEETTVSSDGSVKYLFRNERGMSYETVFIPEGNRNTVCVSTQSGCRMGCPFCATGKYGFHGNLEAGDIVNQVISLPDAGRTNHVVFMGMGEPMDNLGNVLRACEILTAEWGLSLSPSKITVSTVGIGPAVREYLEKSRCNLTLSLFTPFPEERRRLLPVERLYPAHEIIEIMKNFPVRKKRRFSVAYIMMNNINDTLKHLEGLKTLLGRSGIRINLLPYHPAGNDINTSSPPEKMQYFKHELNVSGISASVRKSRGEDINAACGLLASTLKVRE